MKKNIAMNTEKLLKILELVWQDDDMMNQDTLFELQDELSILALEVAIAEGKQAKLINKFPWLYETKPY